MKIRGDFVTNSSSVSYILTMKEDVFDVNIAQQRDNGLGNFLVLLKIKLKMKELKQI